MKLLRRETGSVIRDRIQETPHEHCLPVGWDYRVGVRDITNGQTFRPVLHFSWGVKLTVSARNDEGGVSVSHDLPLLTDVGEVHPVVDPAGSVRGELEAKRRV